MRYPKKMRHIKKETELGKAQYYWVFLIDNKENSQEEEQWAFSKLKGPEPGKIQFLDIKELWIKTKPWVIAPRFAACVLLLVHLVPKVQSLLLSPCCCCRILTARKNMLHLGNWKETSFEVERGGSRGGVEKLLTPCSSCAEAAANKSGINLAILDKWE